MGGHRRAWLLLVLLLSGCQNKDAQHLARLGTIIGEKTQTFLLGQCSRLAESCPSLPIALGEMALDVRVSARLRWDSKLAKLAIRVRAAGGTVELQGTVENLEQRRRAVELAETTLGVTRVSDKLEGPE